MPFTFNKNYKDRSQIAEFFDDFAAIHAEILAAGQYPNNSRFKGRIPGLAASTDKDEDSAIYMLQTELSLREMEAKVAACLATGFEAIDRAPDETTKFAVIVCYGFYVSGTGWVEWHNARFLRHSGSDVVLPKGKRTHGTIALGKLLVKR